MNKVSLQWTVVFSDRYEYDQVDRRHPHFPAFFGLQMGYIIPYSGPRDPIDSHEAYIRIVTP
jgi:hypothetical protein